ncbi:MAG: response regulator transcription factor [Acidobacteria bacterium]|nr:response regulator transcription factor [Acidobacteriota bacterium]MCI0624079.1 response regulator transcription factor [Acidobacteriota bacterium]MCI0719016.1 response regulator transcription factor [Acidobacteriota bacterium]
MKILIAEDDLVSRIVLSELLNKHGHDVTAVENGRLAWDLYSKQHAPLLISDWMMPEMDGLELCRKVRAEKRSSYTYIILLTALSGKANYLEGMEAGADDFVVKPFDADELQARLRVAERILTLQQEVRQLRGLLPICSYCKKIRDDRNIWTQLEQYVTEHSEVLFSHSLCPECYDKEMKPQLDKLK